MRRVSKKFSQPFLENLLTAGLCVGKEARKKIVRKSLSFGSSLKKEMRGGCVPRGPREGRGRNRRRGDRRRRVIRREACPKSLPPHPAEHSSRVAKGEKIRMGLDDTDHPFLAPPRQAPHHGPSSIGHRPAILSNKAGSRKFPKVFGAHDRANPTFGVSSMFGHSAKFVGCQGFGGLYHGRESGRGPFTEGGESEVVEVMQQVRSPLSINPRINREMETFQKKRVVKSELEEVRALTRQAAGRPGRHALEDLDQHRSRNNYPRKTRGEFEEARKFLFGRRGVCVTARS
jgi:hypothetical protein